MMKFFLFCLFLLTCPALAQDSVPSTAFSLQQEELAQKVESYFNGIQTIKSKFYQISDNGATAEGIFYALKPNKMRLEYDSKHPIEVVADGYYLIFHDKKLEQVTYLNLDDNPAAIILKKDFSFKKEGLDISNFDIENGLISLTIQNKKHPEIGKITLVFKDSPFTLKQWRVTDAQQITTTVTLDNMETNIELDEQIFKFKDPKKNLRPGDNHRRSR